VHERVWNIALVGCGGMAASYRHRYTEIPDARLALLIDADAGVAEQAAREHGVANWGMSFEAALSPEIDIVDISTPNFLHAPQAIAAMKAGKHVLIQKPIAPTIEEAQAIVETARQARVQAGMYMSLFDNPMYHDLKRLMRQGLLGRVSSVNCRCAGRSGLRMQSGTWRQSLDKTGGGSFIQLAIHPINMAQWLLDDRVVRVAAFSKNMMCPAIGGDDVTAAACEFAGGALGTLSSSYCAGPSVLSLHGSKGHVSVFSGRQLGIMLDEPYEGELIHYDRPGESAVLNLDLDLHALGHGENPHDQHIAFVRAIQQGRPAPIPVETGLYDLKIAKAVYRSAEEKRFVNVV